MRVVIDLQGCQTASRFRGIGRYSMSFTKAVLRNRGENEVIVVLNGLISETVQAIRDELRGLLPPDNIRVWHAPGPVADLELKNAERREQAEYIRESFIASLHPDVVHISSLFEGFGDDAVVSIGKFEQAVPVSVSFYDLIPYRNPEKYLKSNWQYELHYKRKIESLSRANLLLAISEYAKNEVTEHLRLENAQVVNVSSAVESNFTTASQDVTVLSGLCGRIGLSRPFVLYSGGADSRKNLFRLIEAYSLLPSEVRSGHQLVLAGHMPEGNILALMKHADSLSLKSDDVIFTGYVGDDELINLYCACRLYVFPSINEGFGLPALEAMSCGTPVIGANASSVPEVIQLEEALFDPYNTRDIQQKILRALVDEDFRARLIANGLRRAPMFSWDETGRRAIAAWENLSSNFIAGPLATSFGYVRSLDAVQHLRNFPNDRSWNELAKCLVLNRYAGIERQLFIDVSELCHRDSATGVQRVVRGYLCGLLARPPAGFRIEPVYATCEAGYKYARNFTGRFLGLNAEVVDDEDIVCGRGDIFFGLDLQHHVQLAHAEYFNRIRTQGVVVKFLVYDLLPIQLAQMFNNPGLKKLHEQLLSMIASMDGAICISKATEVALQSWISDNCIETAANFQTSWVHIGGDIEGSSPSKGLALKDVKIIEGLKGLPTFLCVSTLEPRKGQQQVLDAFELLWNEGVEVNLVFVGKQGWNVEVLAERIRTHQKFGHRLIWLEGITDEYLGRLYEVSTCLIAASINEGFGLPLIEAARYGRPVIARDIPVFREVAGDQAHFFNGAAPGDLSESVLAWLGNTRRQSQSKQGNQSWLTWGESTEDLKQELVQFNYPRRQILVDVSELVQRDAKTGIQRVVSNVLGEWLRNPPEGYRVEPVYATVEDGYRYAREFSHRFLGGKGSVLPDEPVEFAPGDVFVGLDFQPHVVFSQREFYKLLRLQGVFVYFVVYDLLCLNMPNNFAYGAEADFRRWLEVVVQGDGVACISRAAADDFANWIAGAADAKLDNFNLKSFALGCETSRTGRRGHASPEISAVLNHFGARPTFLMVGTLEPRKGHEQMLFAFEQLWGSGQDINLVFVGKRGWKVDALVSCIQTHEELHSRLFWLNDASDEDLEDIYCASTCLISASYGEGFGLPLVEAAAHGLPIIARDLPVFREVCETHAYYFAGKSAGEIARAVSDWLILFEADQHPAPNGVKKCTWKETAEKLLDIVLGG